jgi:heat shock protein HtpX
MFGQLKTALLLGLLTALLIMIGGALGGRLGLIFAFGMAFVMNVASYWYSDKIVLKMYKAREVSPGDAPALHAMVDELTQAAGIPKPKVCIIPQETPNAFATGRNPQNGVVAVTEGIMRILTPAELKGVIAHELGHIKNRDILVQTVAAVIAGAIVYIANIAQFAAIFGFGGNDEEGGNPIVMLLLAFLAPVAAMLVQMAISRTREYGADKSGAEFNHDPMALASALDKISNFAKQKPIEEGNPATAHMFIINPFAGKMAGLFSTHPPVEERIARLRAMAGASA